MIKSIIKPAYAQITNPVLNNGAQQVNNPIGFFNSVLQTVLGIFFLVAVLYFLWHFVFAAYHMIASNGDPKKYEEARNAITYAFVGLLITFSVFAVLKFVGTVTGITGLDVLQLQIPTLSP